MKFREENSPSFHRFYKDLKIQISNFKYKLFASSRIENRSDLKVTKLESL